MTICPCCGFKFEGAMSNGCEACGARAVGEPLPKPEHELPSYARSLLLAVTGMLMVLAFLTETGIALAKQTPLSLSFWSWDWLAAGETAAWRLKWVAIPVTIVLLWSARRVYRSMLESPARFCGMRYARAGLVASAGVPLLIAVLIGVTVPTRLEHRQWGIEASSYALGYTFERALQQYREKFGKLPDDLNDLTQLPDPDGSITAALKSLDPKTYPTAYRPSADVAAALPKRKSRTTVIKASLNTASDEALTERLSFTNYELRLPGADKLLGTEDDLVVRDGQIKKASESSKPVSTTASTKASKR